MNKCFKLLFQIGLFVVILLSSCLSSVEDMASEDDSKSIVPFLVDTILLDQGYYCEMETPIIYEDKLIIMITNYETSEGWINCYNKESLDLIWTWREATEEFGAPAKGFSTKSYLENSILCISQNNLSYGIDVRTGETIWKNRDVNTSISYLSGCNNKIVDFEYIDFNTLFAFRVGNIDDGLWNRLFELNTIESYQFSVGLPLCLTWNNVEYVAYITTYWKNSPYVQFNILNLFNLTENKLEWISDTIPLRSNLSNTPGLHPEFEDGQILLANDALYSYNIEDGSLEWWKEYDHTFTFSSQLTSHNGIVYGNNENQFFTGVDVHTGEEKFRTPTGASASRIFYHDNKCYLSSLTVGGSNHMMVIDAETGAILQDEKAPFRSENVEWVFDRAIAVDPETGYVYTGDHRYLLVYDFGD